MRTLQRMVGRGSLSPSLSSRLIPPYNVQSRAQATRDIALRRSADARRHRVLLTLHSAGVRELGSSPSADIEDLYPTRYQLV